jgi:hypothetical protein
MELSFPIKYGYSTAPYGKIVLQNYLIIWAISDFNIVLVHCIVKEKKNKTTQDFRYNRNILWQMVNGLWLPCLPASEKWNTFFGF